MNHHLSQITSPYTKRTPIRLLSLAAIIALALAFMFQSAALPVASAQAQDSILGIVTNGTEGGVLPENLEVLLLSIDLASNQIIEQESTTVDEDGIFSFSNLVSGPGLSYRVVVNSGTFTPSVDMANQENWQNVRMKIYDETTSLDEITINSYVMMIPTIDARSKQAGILTVINVDNRGDEIWTPDLTDPDLTGLDLLRFNLPEGFEDLAIESELPTGNILEIETGFALTNPIPPGEAAVLISYILPYEGDGFDFNLKLPYGADKVRMLIPDEGGIITAEGFGGAESVVVAENVFNQFEGTDYAAGTELLAKFSGLPQPTPLQQLSDFFKGRTYVIVIIWVVGIALLAILGYAMYSSRKRNDLSSDDDNELVGRADVIAEIAELDEEFESGNIEEDDYNDRRDELKRLVLEFDDDSSDALDLEDADDNVDSDVDSADPAESSEPDSEDEKPKESDK
ncbi:MAG: carboxypeptidase regulatory-like domain-containing protein [Chloroflexi bacterium]|jgi:uncharacterized membrane protein|nr:carboxypeptidase regulatory-like domain-containing protein [Chloroflexota bacterium]MBT4125894.1 carboxypeptidase regulatory-like domain-containing protein [Chloroflexota bacterium]